MQLTENRYILYDVYNICGYPCMYDVCVICTFEETFEEVNVSGTSSQGLEHFIHDILPALLLPLPLPFPPLPPPSSHHHQLAVDTKVLLIFVLDTSG